MVDGVCTETASFVGCIARGSRRFHRGRPAWCLRRMAAGGRRKAELGCWDAGTRGLPANFHYASVRSRYLSGVVELADERYVRYAMVVFVGRDGDASHARRTEIRT